MTLPIRLYDSLPLPLDFAVRRCSLVASAFHFPISAPALIYRRYGDHERLMYHQLLAE